MNTFDDFIIKNPYQPDENESKAIKELQEKELTANDWGSRKKGIASFKENIREHLLDEQNNYCAYCRMELNEGCEYVQRDHIVPKTLHPKWLFETKNLCITCSQCNNNKKNVEVLVNPDITYYPSDSDDFKIINPYIDKYSEHINIVEDIIYKGITNKGKFTIKICNLDRIDLVLNRARKRMQLKNPESVKTQILSLLENKEDSVERTEILNNRLDKLIEKYKQQNPIE